MEVTEFLPRYADYYAVADLNWVSALVPVPGSPGACASVSAWRRFYWLESGAAEPKRLGT